MRASTERHSISQESDEQNVETGVSEQWVFMRRFDCFMFHNETAVLRLRLEELWDVVDIFICVEGRTTYAGGDRRELSELDPSLVGEYAEKLRLVTVDLPGKKINRWINEITQRNAIRDALSNNGAKAGDQVLISDVDEIPDLTKIRSIQHVGEAIIQFQQSWRLYHLDLVAPTSWYGTRMCDFETMTWLTPTEIRLAFTRDTIQRGGWHLSYLSPRGQGEAIFRNKVKDFSHSELGGIPSQWPRLRAGMPVSHMAQILHQPAKDDYPKVVLQQKEAWDDHFYFRKEHSEFRRQISRQVGLLAHGVDRLRKL
jgi:beta-1,4-mannosyl-glycoprotein beta-1,4-N-acetylglucosaminyltransferase